MSGKPGMIVLAVGAALLLTLGAAHAGEALKVGFLYVSPIGDAGWTYQHDLGRKAMEQALGKNEPAVIEVPCGDMPDPWQFIDMPKVRGT